MESEEAGINQLITKQIIDMNDCEQFHLVFSIYNFACVHVCKCNRTNISLVKNVHVFLPQKSRNH